MHRNPADLLALDRDPAIRLLYAAGIDKAVVRGGSDYDRFLALAEAMPLCRGHAQAVFMERSLQEATDLSVPLCPHTAPLFWQRWIELYWYGKHAAGGAPVFPPCALCTSVEPTRLHEADITMLPDPVAWSAAADPAELSHLIELWRTVLTQSAPYALVSLPSDYTFLRPDPYHAGLALQAVTRERATPAERDLLLSQSLRVMGEVLNASDSPPVVLLLRGGSPEAVASLCAYLSAVGRLPALLWIPADPSDAAVISGLYPQVGTGYAIVETDSPDKIREIRATYARIAPIGRAVELILKSTVE